MDATETLRPCKCDICFFWKEGLIDGIYHYARGKTREERQPLVNPKRGRKYVFGCVNFLHLVDTAEAAIELKKLSWPQKPGDKLLESKEIVREESQTRVVSIVKKGFVRDAGLTSITFQAKSEWVRVKNSKFISNCLIS